MGLFDTVSAERLHIGFFGMRNAGKSSLVNAVTGQSLSLVSEVKGTTTDPVKKAMELLPLGPVVIIDTPGLDDEGELGKMRVQRARESLVRTDIAVLVVDGSVGLSAEDEELRSLLTKRKIPYIIAYNKADLTDARPPLGDGEIYVSSKTGEGISELKEMLGRMAKDCKRERPLLSDLISRSDLVVLVTPIDESAPKGRLILPQQLTLREILDSHATAVVCQPEELSDTLASLKKRPRMVITDSQVFGRVAKDTPSDIPLTSFSILMARYKGDLSELVRGFRALSRIKSGDKILISEGCTHHRQCNDIGTIKLPGWIREFTSENPELHFTSGTEFPEDLTPFSVVVHCGGCMLNETEMKGRIERARTAGVPIVNYGVAIAGMRGILRRSLELFPDMLSLLD